MGLAAHESGGAPGAPCTPRTTGRTHPFLTSPRTRISPVRSGEGPVCESGLVTRRTPPCAVWFTRSARRSAEQGAVCGSGCVAPRAVNALGEPLFSHPSSRRRTRPSRRTPQEKRRPRRDDVSARTVRVVRKKSDASDGSDASDFLFVDAGPRSRRPSRQSMPARAAVLRGSPRLRVKHHGNRGSLPSRDAPPPTSPSAPPSAERRAPSPRQPPAPYRPPTFPSAARISSAAPSPRAPPFASIAARTAFSASPCV